MSGTQSLKATGTGVAAGFFSGLFGVGGGVLIVPGLMLFLNQHRKLAHGTSLAAIVPIAIAGAATYALDGAIDVAAAVILAVGGMVGAWLGVYLLEKLPVDAVRYGFGVVLLVSAVRMAFEDLPQTGSVDLTATTAIGLALGGVLAGVLAGLLGMGGGIVIVPLLVIAFGVPFDVARGTSLLVIVPTAVVGTWRNVRHRQVDLKLGVTVGVIGAIAAVAGVATALWMDTRIAGLLFAGLMVIMGVRTLATKDRG